MIYLVADHAAFELKKSVLRICQHLNIGVTDLYPVLDLMDDYPDVAKILADKLEEGDDALGIALCGTAEGICMALNRFDFIRAATVDNPVLSSIVRRHNHANVLCIPGPYAKKDLPESMIQEIIETFVYTNPDMDPRHVRRVHKLSQL